MRKKLLSRVAVTMLALSMLAPAAGCGDKTESKENNKVKTATEENSEKNKDEKTDSDSPEEVKDKDKDKDKDKKSKDKTGKDREVEYAEEPARGDEENAPAASKQKNNISEMSVKSNYKITYKANGGDEFNMYTESSDGYASITNSYPTRTGYVFAGWNMAPDGSGKAVMPGQKVHIDQDVVLYAQWKSGQYSIKYELNGGANDIANPISYNSGEYIYLKDATRDGFTFLGWYTDPDFNSPYDSTRDYGSNLTLYAKWQVNKYNVQFLANGGTFNGYTDVTYSLVYSNKYKIPNPVKAGYRFTGWAISGAGEIVEKGADYSVLKIGGNAVLTALWESESTPEETKLVISNTSLKMTKGQVRQITANYSMGITYESSNPSVAAVDNEGNVTAIGRGKAVITVYYNRNSFGEKSAKCEVTVEENAVVPEESLVLSNSTVEINRAENTTVKLSLYYSNSNNDISSSVDIKWTSSNENVVTVSNGLISAKNSGTAVVTATDRAGRTARCVVKVNDGVINADTVISLDRSEVVLDKDTNKKMRLAASTNSKIIRNTEAEWFSSDESVCRVNRFGDIYAISKGTAVITAKLSNGSTASCTVKVIEKTSGNAITFIQDSITLDMTGNYSESIDVVVNKAGYTSKSVKWESSDAKVAVVDNTGKVTAWGNGSAVIKGVLPDGSYASCRVTVNTTATGISLDKKTASLINGGNNKEIQLSASAVPSTANLNTQVSWSSSDENVATVDANGKVTAKGTGTAIIEASLPNGESDVCVVTVAAYEAPFEIYDENDTKVETLGIDLADGKDSGVIKAKMKSDGSAASVKWFVSDESIISVNEAGEVKYLKNGRADITAMDADGNTVQINVVVYTTVRSLEITGGDTIDINKTNTLSLKAQINPATANVGNNITWSSSDDSTATVDENGNVVALKQGTVTIKAVTDNGVSASHEIKIEKVETTMEVEKNMKIDLNSEKKTMALNVKINNSSSEDDKVLTFESSDENVAAVDADGVVSAKAVGTCKITVTTKSGLSAECEVSVVKSAKGIGFKEDKVTIKVGEEKTLAWTFSTLDVSEKDVTFTSSDENVVTIDKDGKIKGIKPGTVMVTVTAENGVSGSCEVTVEQ